MKKIQDMLRQTTPFLLDAENSSGEHNIRIRKINLNAHNQTAKDNISTIQPKRTLEKENNEAINATSKRRNTNPDDMST